MKKLELQNVEVTYLVQAVSVAAISDVMSIKIKANLLNNLAVLLESPEEEEKTEEKPKPKPTKK
jgi:hypothetical protein